MTEITIRMKRCGIDNTLHGYVFSDRAHARQWLAGYTSESAGFQFEEVQVGPLMPCPRCGGAGHRQDVKAIRRLTFAEVLQLA